MNLDQYLIASDNSHLTYKFDSIGPKGIIRKLVSYRKINTLNKNYYNLSFGDWDKVNGRVNDTIISNNSDTKKILFTVGLTALQFLNHFPSAEVFIEGSTISRTRLYQMTIRQYIVEIDKLLDLKGYRNGNWEMFKPGINYEAFLLKKKINNL